MNLLDLMVTVGVDDQTSSGINAVSANVTKKLATAAKAAS